MRPVITIKAWKRDKYLKQVIESLNKCIGISDIPVIIGIDPWEPTKQQMLDATNSLKCKELHVFYHQEQLGCAGNTKWCFDQAFELNDFDYMIHLEDDTPVAPDFINWMLWAGEYMDNRVDTFAACPFTRKVSGSGKGDRGLTGSTLGTHFDCGGGFGFTKFQWEEIKELGGMFGCVGNCNVDLPPEKWKNRPDLFITWEGSWAWPFNKFFRRNRVCIYPNINRSNNIGAEDGLFNPNPAWHAQHVYTEYWAGADNFKDIDWNIIQYEEPL